MASIFVVHCKDGSPCRANLDEGTWVNFTWVRNAAGNDVLRLDRPEDAEGAKFLKRNDPNAFAVWKGKAKPAKCGPHRVVEYAPVP